MPVNPYQWLGIDPRITNPNYFQLLAVDPKLADEADFVQQIKAAVVSKKKLLKQVDVSKYKEVIDKLEVRIDKAAAVLADPKLRNEYLARLKAATSQQTSLASQKENPEPPAVPPKFEDIPMAIPICAVTSTVSQPASQPPGPNGDEQGKEIPSFKRFSSSKPTELGIDESLLIQSSSLHAPFRRRNRSPVLWIATGGFFLAAIAGLVWAAAFFLNSTKRELATESRDHSETHINQPQIPVATPSDANESKISDNSMADRPVESIANLNSNSQPEPEFANDRNGMQSATDDKLNQSDEKTTAQEAKAELGNERADPHLEEYLKPLEEIKRELSEHEYIRLVKHFRLIRSSIDRRDNIQAERRLATLDESIEQFDAERTEALDQLRKWSGSYKQFLDYVNGFQKQYMDSASKISPAQTFLVSGIEYAFVEVTQKSITLRAQGVNLTFDWKFLPLDLAIEIAKQGEIPDVPSYRFFEAAFRAAQPSGLIESGEEIESLISQSVLDGHKDSDFKRYLFDYELMDTPMSQHELTLNQRHANAIGEIRKELKYADLNSLVPDRASEIYERLTRLETDDPTKLVAALREGVDVAIRSLDAELVVEAVKELSLAARTNYYELMLESLTQVASRKLDASQTMGLKRALESLGTKNWMLTRVHKQLVKNLESRIEQLSEQHQLQGYATVSAVKK